MRDSLLSAVLFPNTFAPISVARNVLAMRADLHTTFMYTARFRQTIIKCDKD